MRNDVRQEGIQAFRGPGVQITKRFDRAGRSSSKNTQNDECNRNERNQPKRRCLCGEMMTKALVVRWEASARICGKRIKALLPILVLAFKVRDHACLERRVHEQLMRSVPRRSTFV